VFGLVEQGGISKTVVLETKGLHLAGSGDTNYKRAVLERLTRSFRDERLRQVGQLELKGASQNEIVCDLLLDEAWEGTLEAGYFA